MDTYIYLLCSPHSGSTLAAFLLGTHPEIATVGELAGRTDYDGYRCSCGEDITACPFWVEVRGRLESKQVSLDLKFFDIFFDHRRPFNSFDKIYDHYFPMKWMDHLKDIFFSVNKTRKQWIESTVMRNVLLSETISQCYQKSSFLDTTKDLYRLKHLVVKLGSKIKVLYMTRDGRGVMNSLVKKEGASDEGAIRSWLWSNKMSQRVIQNYCSKDQVLYFKYEDLCSNTESTLKEIFRFVGVSSQVEIDYSNPLEFHVIGNAMRKTFTGNVSLDEKWKKDLSKDQIILFEDKAGLFNQKLGYS